MAPERKLLVVDDEKVICEACRRVFSRQGFAVNECTDARQGLELALQNDYAVILLDIKMPGMDGIEFLEELRKTKPTSPVLIITGYPSIPDAAAAVRLGASDYVTKPFTPEEITQAVQRVLRRDSHEPALSGASSPAESVGPVAVAEGETLFLDEAWLRLEEDGSACVGAVLPLPAAAHVETVLLPRIGEVAYQGLPLAAVSTAEKSLMAVPAPVSGVVVAVNELLGDKPSALWDAPCGQGWIACICTTRLEEELARCKPRRVILFNTDPQSAGEQRTQLAALGCAVDVVSSLKELCSLVQRQENPVVVLYADCVGEAGPELVGQIHAAAPGAKVVVAASSACSAAQREAAYRQQGIFYYAVEPFADAEIRQILDAAFRAGPQQTAQAEPPKLRAESVGGIHVINRHGHRVQLLAVPSLPNEKGGLGWRIRQKLTDRLLPIVTTTGDVDVSPPHVLKAAAACDRVIVMTATDRGRLPGSLVRRAKPDLDSPAVEPADKVISLEVQPNCGEGGLLGFDERTTEALAEHIVREMASC